MLCVHNNDLLILFPLSFSVEFSFMIVLEQKHCCDGLQSLVLAVNNVCDLKITTHASVLDKGTS